jgi:hypothetical protein
LCSWKSSYSGATAFFREHSGFFSGSGSLVSFSGYMQDRTKQRRKKWQDFLREKENILREFYEKLLNNQIIK